MSQVASRALQLLELVSRSDSPPSLMELVTETGLDKSTAARLLSFLEERSLVTRDAATKRYGVGPRLLGLAASAMRRADLRQLAEPALVALRDETGETVSLHLRVGDERICVAGAESRNAVRRVLSVGESVPIWIGPAGKTILAFLPGDEIEAVLARSGLAAAAADRVRGQLELLARSGYLAVLGDRTPGVGAISVPVFGSDGVLASITIAGPAERWTLERMEGVATALRTASARLTTVLAGASA